MNDFKDFSPEQVELIKNTIARGATDAELQLFMATCRRTGLDPFSRQIFMIERRFKKDGEWQKKMEIQVSIDGFRVIAERTGLYQGQDGPYWCGANGVWVDVWLATMPPLASKIGILKKGFTQPLWAVAKWESYAQRFDDGNPMKMWAKMGDVMLAKCAESLGLRRAFPNDLSGIYSDSEMAQADNELPAKHPGPNVLPPAPSLNQSELNALKSSNGTIAVTKIVEAEAKKAKVVKNHATGEEREVPDWVTESQGPDSFNAFPQGPVIDTTDPLDEAFDPGDYKVEFGREIGKTLHELGPKSVERTLGWIKQVEAEKPGKPLVKSLNSFREYAALYLMAQRDGLEKDSFVTESAKK